MTMKNESTPINPVDQVLPHIAKAVAEWQVENTAQIIKKRVKAALDKESEQILLKLMGFDASWGDKWELDHCNGRSGESAAGDFIRIAQSEAIKEWLTEVILPKMTPALKAKLQKEAQREYTDTLLNEVRRKAAYQASTDLDKIISTMVQSNNVDSHIKLMQLVNPSGVLHGS